MKHIKTLIFALLCALAGTAWADTETLGGYEFTIETDGEGSYYKVDCPAALDAIATYVNSNNSHTCSGKRFKQTADITYSYETAWNSDASYTSNYTPIGGYFNSRDRFFKGTYDGQGHTISGIRINKYGGNSAGIKEFVLNFGEDDADGIDIPTPDTSRDGGEVIFNLAGQRLQKMQKGININKGKKIIIK